MRYTPTRCTPMKCRPVRNTPMRHMPTLEVYLHALVVDYPKRYPHRCAFGVRKTPQKFEKLLEGAKDTS